MSTKDLMNVVLDDIVSEATVAAITPPTATQATTTPATTSTTTLTTSTTATLTSTKMTEEDKLTQKLLEEKREIQEQIEEIQEKREVSTEKQIYLRSLRAKKQDITRELRILLERKSEEKYEKAYKKKVEEERNKAEVEVNTIFQDTTDVMKPNKDTQQAFVRDFNMFGKYKDTINELRKEIHQLMARDTSEMTQHIIDDRDLMITRV